MSGDCNCFRAADAFAYVDTYRRLILSTPNKINSDKERLEELAWSQQLVPSRTFAELRAHEDALKFLVEAKEPGLVRLSEMSEKGAPAPAAAPGADRETLKQKDLEILDLQNKLRLLKESEHNLQIELVQTHQELARVKRKLFQTYSSLSVAATTLLIVGSVLLLIHFFR